LTVLKFFSAFAKAMKSNVFYFDTKCLLSYSVFVFTVPHFFVSVPCARLSWPFRQLFSTRKYTASYHIVSYITDTVLQI